MRREKVLEIVCSSLGEDGSEETQLDIRD